VIAIGYKHGLAGCRTRGDHGALLALCGFGLDVCLPAVVLDELGPVIKDRGTGGVISMQAQHEPGMGGYIGIWIGLLLIVGIEVFLTLQGLPTYRLLAILLILAFIEAGIGLFYFMHLKYEQRSLVWSLTPAVVFVLFMMNHIWPDAYRLTSLKVPISVSGPGDARADTK
jgi:cytochrome c oxidase subunit IV